MCGTVLGCHSKQDLAQLIKTAESEIISGSPVTRVMQWFGSVARPKLPEPGWSGTLP